MDKDNRHHHGGPGQPAARRRPVHHSPMFWIAVVLFLAAITIYVLSDDLSWRPQLR